MSKQANERGKHTPVPWDIDKIRTANGAPIIMSETCWLGNRREIAKVLYHGGSEDPEVQANARHIVRCVNGFDGLVEALDAVLWSMEKLQERLTDGVLDPSIGLAIMESKRAARAALKNAEE